jgi:integrase
MRTVAVPLSHTCTHRHARRHHGRACQWLNNGMPMSAIGELLGHDSIATTSKIYARYNIRERRAAFDRYSQPADVE